MVGGAALAACVSEAPPATTDDGGVDEAGVGAEGGGDGGGGTDGGGVDAQAKPGTLLWSYVVDIDGSLLVRVATSDTGDVCFVSSASGLSPIKVAGQSYAFPNGLAVGKLSSNGTLAWLKVYNVAVASDSIDIAVAPDGDVWLLGGGLDTGAHQDWNGTPVAKISKAGRGDIFWTHLSGVDGSFKSAYQISTPSSGGIDRSGFTGLGQTVRLARAGNQLVGAFGHHGPVQLPSAGGDIPVSSGTGEAVTVFRADPTNGQTGFHDTYTGGVDGLSPGAITVLPDGNAAVAINIYGSKNQTVTNSQGGVSVTRTGAGTSSYFFAARYTSANTASLLGAYNQDGDSPDAGFGAGIKIARADSIAMDGTGRTEIGGWFTGANVPMDGTLFQDDGDGDSFIMSVSGSGAVVDHPDFATTGYDNASVAAYVPNGQLVVGSLYGGTVSRLNATPSGEQNNAGLAQFSLYADGGIAWNAGFLIGIGETNDVAPAIAVHAATGNTAFAHIFRGQINFGTGLTDVPNGGGYGVVILDRAP